MEKPEYGVKNLEKHSNINIEKEIDLDAVLGNDPDPNDPDPNDPDPNDPDPNDPDPNDPDPNDPDPNDPDPNDPDPNDPDPNDPDPDPNPLDEGIVDLNEPDPNDPDPNDPDPDKNKGNEVDFIKIGDKKVDVESVEKELGRLMAIEKAIADDPFLMGFIQHYDGGGDPLDYISAKKTDYSKVGNFDLLKDTWFSENADLNDNVKSKMFALDMKEKYGYDVETGEFSEDGTLDVDILSAKMERDANKVRATKVEHQKKFAVQKRDNGLLEQGVDNSANIKEHTEKVTNHQHTKTLSESGMIAVEVDGNKYGIKVKDTENIVNMAIDDESFFKLFGVDENGITDKTDLQKFYKVASMAVDPASYDKKLISIGRTLERREQAKLGKNLYDANDPKHKLPPEGKKSEKRSLLEAFKKEGVHYTT
jgi:hypothetical protein